MSKKNADDRRSQYKDSKGRVRSFPDLKIDGLFDEMADCRLQFRRLNATADKWTSRIDSLRSKQKYLRRGFTQLDLAVESMRDEARCVDACCNQLDGRLAENFTIGVPNTEQEWRHQLEEETLIANAVELLQLKEQQHQPKEFYYSAEDDTSTCATSYDDDCSCSEDSSAYADGWKSRTAATISRAETETLSAYMTLSDGWTSVANLTSDEESDDDDDEELNNYLRMATINCRIEDAAIMVLSDAGFHSDTSKEDQLSST